MSEKRYWLNVDKPDSKKCTLHTDKCSYILKEETPYKSIERLKRDGGWFVFPSRREAIAFYEQEWKPQGYSLSEDCYCLRK